jgi:hypothetical protein
MTQPRLFLCGGAASRPTDADDERHTVLLSSIGTDANVTIKIEDIASPFTRLPAPRLIDALEVASYVYAADAKTRRGTQWAEDSIEPWTRDLKFRIAVRDLAFWHRADVLQALTKTVRFLTDDKVEFEFAQIGQEAPLQEYLDLGPAGGPLLPKPTVLMFSGGLDSLAGATELAARGRPLLLVSHRPVASISARQRKLVSRLRALYPSVRILHVPVWINKASSGPHEPTQRTRSFLFSVLGTVVARMFEADTLHFFENGVVSLNLPVADEAIRARSSRTTNPLSLRYLSDIASLIADSQFAITNPYLYLTKAEVVGRIVACGAGDLIGLSVSCAHSMFKGKSQQHCGMCSQCIDRRIGVLAAGVPDLDPETDYVRDVFTGTRDGGEEANIAVHYARHATELERMSEEEFAARFNLEIARAIRGVPDASEAAQRLYDLHSRHAQGVCRVLASKLQDHASDILKRRLPQMSLLGLIAGQKHERSMWQEFATRIAALLQAGLPRACASIQAKDERHLQEIADGILAGHDLDLIREFPFMRWSGSSTKPDWSNEHLELWVELKYVRKRADLRPITKDVAEDITKYGDNARRVLYVVYDPNHKITDEVEFRRPLRSRPSMFMAFVR